MSGIEVYRRQRKSKSKRLRNEKEGFPGSVVIKNPPANAGDLGSIPYLGTIPHAMEQLSLWATTREPVL